MTAKHFKTLDANEAVASVSYRTNEVIAIYPITPSSPMAEWADAWVAEKRPNLWGTLPHVYEMQSEAGVAGAVHGALQTGALATTFTASQGLLLMIPNMYKIAGELTPTVFHVAARSLAAQALSIFGDHSDVMGARQTGWAMLCSASVQEAMDFALISQAASLKSRIPFLHFFDGFRTSHEVNKVEWLEDELLRAMIDEEAVKAHRARALTPERPVLRGTAQNPDVYFQGRESANPFYAACPAVTQEAMDLFARHTGRQYHLYDYYGAPDAERVVIVMGSGAETVQEMVRVLNRRGAKLGMVQIRLYRPFDIAGFVRRLPASVRAIAVLDRTKEPGAGGEPLYLDVVGALHENAPNGKFPTVIGGRYGLSSKEFTPAMAKAVFDLLSEPKPKNHFTVGIHDDVSNTSIPWDPDFSIEDDGGVCALFYGLGSDGTVSANKNSIKIIGENTDGFAQGYFVYDSKKSGSITISHLRFGPRPIRAPYLVDKAGFIGIHQPIFLDRFDLMKQAAQGATVLLNTAHGSESIWGELPRRFQEELIAKKLKLYVIDAYRVARDSGMGGLINTTMQVCFFAISGVLPRDKAIDAIKDSIRKTYGRKGEDVVQKNLRAVDQTLAHLHQVPIPSTAASAKQVPPPVSAQAPEFVRNVLAPMMMNEGDDLPVSAMPVDGTYPTGTARWEKRNLAQEIPVWDPGVCIQCSKCVMVCPHSVIRSTVAEPAALVNAPATLKSRDAIERDWKGLKFLLQVAPEDCTGCGLCVEICPARNKSETRLKAINMQPQEPLRAAERDNWNFFLSLPDVDRRKIKVEKINQQQVERPLFEFSGACAGCGETPYVKLLSQLFGERMLVANATGCSSIYGGNLPTTPWTTNGAGRGPAWSNSLFEDNAEFGLGFRLSLDQRRDAAETLLRKLASEVGETLVDGILQAPQRNEADIHEQRERVRQLRERLKLVTSETARLVDEWADVFVKKSVWIVGGDGWAYDIGFGGLDHVLASGKDVNILVLDTGVYSNTGGQRSKATPRGAVAKFASGGKESARKDLGYIAMTYGNVYVAQVAMGARDEHTLRAFLEAESFDGPSLIIAYSHCIAHGIVMKTAFDSHKAAVASGNWLLYRYDPRRLERGEKALALDSKAPSIKVEDYFLRENRFKMLTKSHPDDAKELWDQAQKDADARWKLYDYLANKPAEPPAPGNGAPAAPAQQEIPK
ncbi:MAG TPA: pyruvate:ferredoxin (flavodoxin) oxidoreductase [Elusimicrobiota bacterium]|nr:pyruvate:ferredoxin (flavodoxin) oxidoreductase [Elusimicrobiota bacterium]